MERVTTHPICTVELEKGIHVGVGSALTTFHPSLGLDYVEQFLEGALECEEFGRLDSSRWTTPRNQGLLYTSASSHPHKPRTQIVTYHLH